MSGVLPVIAPCTTIAWCWRMFTTLRVRLLPLVVLRARSNAALAKPAQLGYVSNTVLELNRRLAPPSFLSPSSQVLEGVGEAGYPCDQGCAGCGGGRVIPGIHRQRCSHRERAVQAPRAGTLPHGPAAPGAVRGSRSVCVPVSSSSRSCPSPALCHHPLTLFRPLHNPASISGW